MHEEPRTARLTIATTVQRRTFTPAVCHRAVQLLAVLDQPQNTARSATVPMWRLRRLGRARIVTSPATGPVWHERGSRALVEKR
jgi:hypothetical protein